MSSVKQTVDSHTTSISGLNGEVSTLKQTASGLQSTVTSLDGRTSKLEQDASGFSISLGEVAEDVETAQSTANTAQSTANTAKTNAATAQSTANTAKTNAATAQSTADSAVTAANNAQSTANTARTEASNAAKTASNFLSFDSSNGLLVGNKSGGSWSGYRAQVKSDSFNILDASGNTLSSYGASAISLGANSAASKINLCSGAGSIAAKNNTASQGLVLNGGSSNVPQMSLTHQGAFMYASNTSNAQYDNAVRCWYGTNGLELYSNVKMSAMVHNGDLNLEAYYGGDIVFRVGSDDGNCSTWSPYHRDGETLTVADCRTAGFVTNSSKDVYFMVPLTKPVISGTTSAVAMSVTSVKLQLRQNGNYTHGTSSKIAPSSATATYVPGIGIHVKCTMSSTTSAINNDVIGIDFSGTFTF